MSAGIIHDKQLINKYINEYCLSESLEWKKCKRYLTNSVLNFCPDFVLPDSTMTIDQIIEKFDKESIAT